MTFRIRQSESVEKAVRRIAKEQLNKSIREIDSANLGPHKKVHQIRKRCKKLRALLRLVRPGLGSCYSEENKALRDTASMLSDFRDARTLIATYDGLMERFEAQVNRAAFGKIRRELTLNLKELDAKVLNKLLRKTRQRLIKQKERSKEWRLSQDNFDAIREGLALTRTRAEERLEEICKAMDTENLHQLRKRTKYHGFHLRLLQDCWSEQFKPLISSLDTLGDILGLDHDLAVFRQTVDESPENFGQPADIQVLRGLIDQRRGELQSSALKLARLVFSEPSSAFIERIEGYWQVWRES